MTNETPGHGVIGMWYPQHLKVVWSRQGSGACGCSSATLSTRLSTVQVTKGITESDIKWYAMYSWQRTLS